MIDRMIVLVAVLASFVANAAENPATYTLKMAVSNTEFDWSEASNYEENAKPSPGDHVIIPKDVNAKLTHGQECWEFVSKLGRIRPTTATSYFTVSIPAGITNSLSCEISNTGANSSDSYDKGGLVKVGGGVLDLTLTQYGYHTAFAVNEGGLRLTLMAGKKNSIDSLYVAEGAFVDLLSDATLVTRWFSGAGNIGSTSGTILQTYTSDSRISDFSGKMIGNLRFNSCSRVLLRGMESTKTGTVYILGDTKGAREKGASVGVAKLGNKNETSSSVGNVELVYFGQGTSSSGGLLYLGEGETSDKDFAFRTHNTNSCSFFDGGANGGLELTGVLSINNNASAFNHRLGLCGSNDTDCVLGMTITERSDTNGNPVSFHIVKSGTGSWKIDPKSASTWSGAVTVEEGTLKFDTLKEAGTFCALGYATNLFECYTGVFDESHRVDWAIALGTSDGKEGALKYTGTDGVACSTRPIALQGDGRICQNAEAPFRFSGIKSDGENAKTLTLEGTGMGGNEISGISDKEGGAISVVKEGSGAWTLSAANSFRGSLNVKSGTLNVCAPNWNWFKFVDKQSYTNATFADPGKGFYVREMAFFNKDGISQTVGLSFKDSVNELVPSCFALANNVSYDVQHTSTYPDANWDSLFNDKSEPTKIGFNYLKPLSSDSSSWAEILVRLPEDSDTIHTFDYVWALENTKNGCNTQPSYFAIMGSFDGFEWKELFSTNYAYASSAGKWVASNTTYNQGDLVAARTNSKKAHHGVALAQPDSSIPALLDSASCVSVAAGATLKCLYGTITLNSFGVDMLSGGGTVEGFAFAEEGTLSLDNVVSGGTLLEKTFTPVNCTGVTNLSNWTLLVNGAATSKYSASVSADGKVRLTAVALRVIIR